MHDNIQMSESSKLKRLWRKRISQQLGGLHLLNTCISSLTVDSQETDDDDDERQPLKHSIQQSTEPIKKLWRKPLPNDCPQFDFSISEKTLFTEITDFDNVSFNNDNSTIPPVVISHRSNHLPMIPPPIRSSSSLIEKTEIPTRYESRHYKNVPSIEARLENVCKNEKAILLTKLLEKQRHKQLAVSIL
ncbi:uncharacterized protein BX663DRAFT_514175 [Cokeromyces recurvatus]|uniref:uncharacterized protein n=1 Tax=Cokeromyces recurvatus TaxID=90255 RepID=UPI00221F9FA0|nr:uncharacterized protein BX663DRAFT_514175 [Cokeromyces recurvatus]KAI7901347.1 hypothetical protein BX663DRAFT_514175 [Cokeromyces recurvatus]